MRLPSATPKQAVRALKKGGFVEVRKRGSHLFLENEDGVFISMPMHTKDLKRGLLTSVIKDAGVFH